MKLKIICYTPKGKAEASSKTFGMQYFGALKKPIETVIVSDHEFWYIYEYEKEKEMMDVINKRIPKAEVRIRQFYFLLIHIIKRTNKLAAKGAWAVEKAKNFMVKMFVKKGGKAEEIEGFIDAISLKDEAEMMEFLSGKLFDYEIMEEEQK